MGTTMSDWMITPPKLVSEKVIPVSNMVVSCYFQYTLWISRVYGIFVGFLFNVLSSEVGNSTFATPGLSTPLRMLLEQRALRDKQRFQVDSMGNIPTIEAEKVLILCGPAHVEEIWRKKTGDLSSEFLQLHPK